MVICFTILHPSSIVMSLLVPLIYYFQVSWLNEHSEVKRKKLEIKLESDDANDNFSFPETMNRRDKRGEETERFVSYRYSLHSCMCMSVNGHLFSRRRRVCSPFWTYIQSLVDICNYQMLSKSVLRGN